MRTVSKVAVIAVLIAMISLCFLPVNADINGWNGFVPNAIATSETNGTIPLYQFPSKSTPVVARYYDGVKLRILEYENNGWCLVQIGWFVGFIQEYYLENARNTSYRHSTDVYSEIKSQGGKVNVHILPYDDSMALGSYKPGTEVEVLGTMGEWVQISVWDDGDDMYMIGFIKSKWLTRW